ncbi:rRNA methyltransferase [Bacillus sp. DNRA2]|uniref:rRNA methyltransferase n=1 Tax=Bacillus sp. DNRA2 TaxID=2723053 RepID=UPI00145E7521|nr:rRNA methyltransferase [Bacillus sp. DNRA2]NMD70460.1 rRNA methyltransferase [Bacillus sp. DNRA2]
MWKKSNGRLVSVTDSSRIKFRTTISKSILDQLKMLAKNNNTYVNYLIESGLQVVLTKGIITYNKELRPKDRIHYKTVYDKQTLENVKKFAKDHDLYINDVIEYSVNHINLENIKNSNYRHRVE